MKINLLYSLFFYFFRLQTDATIREKDDQVRMLTEKIVRVTRENDENCLKNETLQKQLNGTRVFDKLTNNRRIFILFWKQALVNIFHLFV